MMLTAHNDNLPNGYNPVQLSAWRANVDMQYVVSRPGADIDFVKWGLTGVLPNQHIR